ncbi:SDR family NAD(P)-dependent oxidoreductase [Streptomyces sp. JV186]|uniref:SDR family NAD(P)-dependent oxidoreductase n=1 Tax=Streptomyces sp. JV186 TaxID=858639 RepID=UPI002E7F76FB|nr:SDR family NAD(P)-dependent oxidoreductase [Streptomyces sp. JV186]
MASQEEKGGRVAIVTGGSRGIGRETVRRLAADGFAVVVGCAGNRELAENAAREVTANGGRAVAVQADIAEEEQVAALFAEAEAAFGGVDVVVNAAGRMHLAPVAELELAELDAVLRTNVRGTFVVARQAARTLRDGGALVTFSTSVVGLAFPIRPAAVLKGGMVVYAPLGDANAAIPTTQPVLLRPTAAAGAGAHLSVSFVAPAALDDGLAGRLGLARELLPVRPTRHLTKADLPNNTALPAIDVDPETFAISIDGEPVVPAPATTLPLAQRYSLF